MRILEVIGPAGAGKSTVAQLLGQSSQIDWVCIPPYFRRFKDFPFFLANTLSMMPTLIHLLRHREGRWFSNEEMAWMIILNGWGPSLSRRAEKTARVILVDEGPIFHLAYLWMRGPGFLHSSHARLWWQKMCRQVANTTDLIIWLDAPNHVLLRRIRTRRNWRLFSSLTDDQICKFLDRLRDAYSHLVAEILAERNERKVLIYETEGQSANEISEQILAEMEFSIDLVQPVGDE